MCGICGILGRGDKELIQKMNDIISYRGPDEKIIIQSGNCFFGMTRLKIKGKSHTINKFSFLNQTIEIIFNGEIYNYLALKNQLAAEGFIFRTDLEVEIIALLYALYGEKFVLKLDGMFAIAIYANDTLFLYRDRLGIKPLYYALDKTGNLYFASEIKSILATKKFSPEINLDFLEDSLVFGFSISKTNSPLKNIYQIPPGGNMVITSDFIASKRYYSPGKGSMGCNSVEKYDEILNNTKKLFENAVDKMFVHDDKDKAICLSGGFDSSLIALIGAQKSRKKIYTYTLTSEKNPNYDDILYAGKVAEKIGSMHELVNIDIDEAWSSIIHFIYHYEAMDFGGVFDPNGGLAFHILLSYASKNAKVIFSGEGADELFCGYGKLHGFPKRFLQKLKARVLKIEKNNKKINRKYNLIFPLGHSEEFYQKRIYNLLLGPGLYNYHLQCVDKSSSAFGAELRPIFLDTDLFEYAKNIDLKFKINDVRTKIMLKDAFFKDFKEVGLENIVTRRKLAMPTALESMQETFSKRMGKLANKTILGPYDHLFIGPEEKVLFDLFHFLFITKCGCTDYGFVSLEEIMNEQEFKRMYS